jgi:ornithine carbamoyltransferase
MSSRHFLTLLDLDAVELRRLIARATELKQMYREGRIFEPLRIAF